jgi:hypothetical protein
MLTHASNLLANLCVHASQASFLSLHSDTACHVLSLQVRKARKDLPVSQASRAQWSVFRSSPLIAMPGRKSLNEVVCVCVYTMLMCVCMVQGKTGVKGAPGPMGPQGDRGAQGGKVSFGMRRLRTHKRGNNTHTFSHFWHMHTVRWRFSYACP